MLDVVAYNLTQALQLLTDAAAVYTVTVTKPPRGQDKLNEEAYYVIRQEIDNAGVYHLTAAAKLGNNLL